MWSAAEPSRGSRSALTLLPAVLSLVGDRVNALRLPRLGSAADHTSAHPSRFWGWAVRHVTARPLVSLLLATALLLALAAPALSLETGSVGFGTIPDRFASRQGSLALERHFSAGRADPATVVVDGTVSTTVRAATGRLTRRLAADRAYGRPRTSFYPGRKLTTVSVPFTGQANSEGAERALRKLRDEHIRAAFRGVKGAEVLVTGETAASLDYAELTDRWRPIIFVLVFALSFVLLLLAFRSLVVPLKALLLNLLSVGAAYGLLVLVFQKGVGAGLLGVTQVDSIEPWVPLFLFSVLFGLSMDYHVFLLSRIREHFEDTGDNSKAVVYGIGSTARLITGAALIIVMVFAGLALGDLVMFQQVGFGVAVALLLDATIVRTVLVPASMELLGARNWYLPSWLRWLPVIGVERAPRAQGEGAPVATDVS